MRAASTDAERKLWNALRDRRLDNRKFRRQFPIGPFFADFACLEAGLVVELDGGQHVEADALAADASRTRVLNTAGYTVLRYTDHQVLTEFDAVLTSILNWLKETP